MKEFFNKDKNRLIWGGIIIYLVLGIWFTVSVTSLYEFMGDDRNNILIWADVYKNQGFLQSILNDISKNIWKIFNLKGRYFPLFLHSTWFLGLVSETFVMYRAYIAVYTFIDIFLLGLLIYRLEHESDMWKVFYIISPFMLCLFGYSDGNALFSYHALVQSVFLYMLVALHMQLSFIRVKETGKKTILALICILFMIIGCFTYELAYLTIFPATLIAVYEQNLIKENGMSSFFAFFKKILYGVIPILIPTIVSFIIYVCAGKGHTANPETVMNLQLSPILMTLVIQMSSGLPISRNLFHKILVPPRDLVMGDILFPLLGAITLLIVFVLPFRSIKKDGYWKPILFGTSLAVPGAILVAITDKFQDERFLPWTGWEGGWITALLSTFGYMVMVTVIIVAIRHYESVVSAGFLRRLVVGIFMALVLFSIGLYNHASSRLACNDSGYTYDLMRDSLRNGGLDEASDGVVILSNYNVWGGDEKAQTNFFNLYGNRKIKAAYVTDYEYENRQEPDWLYSMVTTQYKEWEAKQCMIYTGKVENDGSYQLNNPRVYVDTTRMKPYMKLLYQYSTGDGYETVFISKDELINMLGYDGQGFIEIDHDHVLPGMLAIYWNEADEE